MMVKVQWQHHQYYMAITTSNLTIILFVRNCLHDNVSRLYTSGADLQNQTKTRKQSNSSSSQFNVNQQQGRPQKLARPTSQVHQSMHRLMSNLMWTLGVLLQSQCYGSCVWKTTNSDFTRGRKVINRHTVTLLQWRPMPIRKLSGFKSRCMNPLLCTYSIRLIICTKNKHIDQRWPPYDRFH